MPYITTIQDQRYTVSFQQEDGQIQASFATSNQTYTIDWQKITPLLQDHIETEGGHYSILIAGKTYTIFARRLQTVEENGGRTYEIWLNNQRFEVTVEDERTYRLSHMVRSTSSTNSARLQAPMPGLVVQVLTEPGMQVEAGQTVIVLEAMKMENDLIAPLTGVVKEIKVEKGQTVDQSQLLMVIEGLPQPEHTD
ncbi:MAG TPA: biotin/lipoyl-containing protein [Dictyobacter sp.]|jgi:biotin carboxyl carrier protein|nr:biotin/lipoyl-containing protein [Dictyobacter sp.]